MREKFYMKEKARKKLKKLLIEPEIEINQKIQDFIQLFQDDALPKIPKKWNIPVALWQRYEFLGDRVLNLTVSEYLFKKFPEAREGELTNKLKVTSNESLSSIIDCMEIQIDLLIPDEIGKQKTYGENVSAGALEAFIGAVYCELGLKQTKMIILKIFNNEIDNYNPDTDYISKLHQRFDKEEKILQKPIFINKEGKPPNETFYYQYRDGDGTILGKGSGKNSKKAKQNAAENALKRFNPSL
jgi:ribonuclease-3